MITLYHILGVIFLFLFMNDGVKSLEKVIYIIISIGFVYYFSNNLQNINIVNNNYNLNKILDELKDFDKININLIRSDIEIIDKLYKINEKNENIYSNIRFLKQRVNNNLDALYLNYNDFDKSNKFIIKINDYISNL